MKTLSSPFIGFYKRIMPVVFGGFSLALVFYSLSAATNFHVIVISLLAFLIASGCYFFVRMHVSVYIDEVVEDGEYLILRNSREEEMISFSDLESIESTIFQPAGVTLYFKRDSIFGRHIKFLPEESFFSYSKLTSALRKKAKNVAEQGAASDR